MHDYNETLTQLLHLTDADWTLNESDIAFGIKGKRSLLRTGLKNGAAPDHLLVASRGLDLPIGHDHHLILSSRGVLFRGKRGAAALLAQEHFTLVALLARC